MSKIQKFLKSALYNSNANEAAQALKLAASTMQSEGLNPADFLEQKGETSHYAELLDLRDKHARLVQSHQISQNMLRQLEHEIGELRRASNSDASFAAELREAKEQAIKWCRRSELNELQLKELAPVAVAAQEKVSILEKELQKQKGSFAGTLGWMLFAAIVVGIMTHLVTKKSSYERGYGVGKFEGIVQAEKNARDASFADNDIRPVPPGLWLPQSGSYDMNVICQGKAGGFKASFKIDLNNRSAKETTHLFTESFNMGLPGEGAVPVGYKFYITLMKSGDRKLCTVRKVW